MVSGGYSLVVVCGFSWCRAQALGHVGFSSCGARAQLPVACGIFPDKGLNSCPLHWQSKSQTLDHQENPPWEYLTNGPVKFTYKRASYCYSWELACDGLHLLGPTQRWVFFFSVYVISLAYCLMCMVVCSNVNSVLKWFYLFCTFVISQNGLEILLLIFSQQFMFQIGCILCLFLFLMC